MDEWSTVGTNTNVQEKLTCRHLLQLRTCVVFVKKLSYLRKRSALILMKRYRDNQLAI